MIDQKHSVLIIDAAIGFGGSIVSTANLIRGLDRSKFEPTFVSATNEQLIRNRLGEASAITRVAIAGPIMHYARMQRITLALRRVPTVFLRKALTYAAYLLRLLLNIPYALRMAWLIHKHRVDLVQLNNSFGNDEIDLVCILMGRPRVVFFRGYTPMSTIERHLLVPGVKAFVSVSEHVKNDAIADGVPGAKIVVATPPAIVDEVDEATRAAIRRKYGVEAGDVVFGIFGRVVAWKGQKEFIRAAAPVLRARPNAKAFIVGGVSDGDMNYHHELQELIRELGVGRQVVQTGYVDRVYQLYTIMDVVVHASIEPEPSGRVIFEAMSCGVPVIASSLGGPKEFIDEGVDGYIRDPNRPEGLGQCIDALLADPALRRRIGSTAQEKVERLHNKRAYAAAVEQVYLDCLRA